MNMRFELHTLVSDVLLVTIWLHLHFSLAGQPTDIIKSAVN